jgi:hypothetical protein
VHVTGLEHFDPPLETGRLPRPRGLMTVLPAGREPVPEAAQWESGGPDHPVHLGDGIPFAFEPLFRPYAFLAPGDEVADRDGRAWRFDGPWTWHPFDGRGPGAPAWPLTLLTRGGSPLTVPADAAAVASATAAGSHEAEAERWRALTRVRPAAADPR